MDIDCPLRLCQSFMFGHWDKTWPALVQMCFCIGRPYLYSNETQYETVRWEFPWSTGVFVFHIFGVFVSHFVFLYHQVSQAEENGNVMLSIVQVKEEWADLFGKQQAKSIKEYQRAFQYFQAAALPMLCWPQIWSGCNRMYEPCASDVQSKFWGTCNIKLQSSPQQPTGGRERVVAGRDEHVERQRTKHDQGPGKQSAVHSLRCFAFDHIII